MAPLPGTILADRYQIERELGQGGMATVYLAHDQKHERDVAIKVLRPELAAVLGGTRFLQEIHISARLEHPHILTLIDSGEAGGLLYYVLPYVRGESLRQKLTRERQLPLEEALAITRQVASALDYAHGRGVIHRDIKPENILLHEGEAVVADFGIALAVRQAGGARLTESGLSLGTPQYMSPEQATGDRDLDARSDVYSLGAVLYEMLAGEPPHTGPTVQAVIAKLLTERPTPLRVVRDTVPEGIEVAVAKALAKVPADRFASAEAFTAALGAGAEPASGRILAPHRWSLVAGIAVLLMMAAVLILSQRPRTSPRAPVIRTQLTFTGRASGPALSPDGKTIAYFERRDCEAEAVCPYDVVVQETEAGGARHAIVSVTFPVSIRWSPDGRRLLVAELERGVFRSSLVSVLGGEPRSLGAGVTVWGASPDTLLKLPAGTNASGGPMWIRKIRTIDGTPVDSVSIGSPWFVNWVIPSPDGKWLGVIAQPSVYSAQFSVTIVDQRGRVVTDLGSQVAPFLAWGTTSDRVYLLEARDGRYQIVRQPLDSRTGKLAGRREPQGDALSTDPFNVDASAGALAYAEAGASRSAVWALEPGAGTADRHRPRRLYETTANILLPLVVGGGPALSPDGSRVVIRVSGGARDSTVIRAFQIPFAGGTLSPLGTPRMWSAAGQNLSPMQLSPDWTRSLWVERSDHRTTMSIGDLSTGVAQELGPAPTDSGWMCWLPNGSICWMPKTGPDLLILDDRLGLQRRIRWPDSLGLPYPIVSPDGSSFALIVWRFLGDSLAVNIYRLSLIDGRVTLLVQAPPVSPDSWGGFGWTTDGWVRVLSSGKHGARMLRIGERDGRVVDDGPAPIDGDLIWMSWSRDGKRAVETVSNQVSDIVLIWNFDPLGNR